MEKNPIQNPLNTTQKIGIGALALLGAGGVAYYFLMAKRDTPYGFKITGYRNKTENGPLVKAGIKLNAKTFDTITVYAEVSYNGKEQAGVTLHAATWLPGTGQFGWLNRTNEIDSGEEVFTLAGSVFPRKYSKAIDIALDNAVNGTSYNLGVWLKGVSGPDYTAPTLSAVIVVGADGGTEEGITNVAVTPITTVPVPVNGNFEFKLDFDYKGVNSKIDIKLQVGKLVGSVFNAKSTWWYPGNGANSNFPAQSFAIATGHITKNISVPVPKAITDAYPNQNLDIWIGIPFHSDPDVPAVEQVFDGIILVAGAVTTPVALTASISPAGTGTVAISPVKTQYYKDDTVILTATPATGYRFQKWTANGIDFTGNTANPVTITLIGDAAMVAVFSSTASSGIITRVYINKVPEGNYVPLPATVKANIFEAFEVGVEYKNTSSVSFISGVQVKITKPDGSSYFCTPGVDGIDWANHPPGVTLSVEKQGLGVDLAGTWLINVRLLTQSGQELDTFNSYFEATRLVPVLTLGTTVIISGGALPFTLVNFSPSSSVQVGIQGGSSVNVTTDSTGAYSGSMTITAAPGLYNVVASDSYGNMDVKQLTVQSSGVASLTISPTTAKVNETFTYNFSGFQPGAQISLVITRADDGTIYTTFYKTADSSGAGSGSFYMATGSPAITYTLTAKDSYGHVKAVNFSITALTQVTLTVDNSPSDNEGFVEVKVNGVVQYEAPSYLINSGAQVVLTAYGLGNYKFGNWYDSEYQFTTQNPISFNMNIDRSFVANFTYVPPPPEEGPDMSTLPNYNGPWWWIVFTDNSADWYDSATFEWYMTYQPEMVRKYYGPYEHFCFTLNIINAPAGATQWSFDLGAISFSPEIQPYLPQQLLGVDEIFKFNTTVPAGALMHLFVGSNTAILAEGFNMPVEDDKNYSFDCLTRTLKS